MSQSRRRVEVDKSAFLDIFLQKVQQHHAEKNLLRAYETMKSIVTNIHGKKYCQRDLTAQQINTLESLISKLKKACGRQGYFELEFVYNLKKHEVFKDICGEKLKKEYSAAVGLFSTPTQHKNEGQITKFSIGKK